MNPKQAKSCRALSPGCGNVPREARLRASRKNAQPIPIVPSEAHRPKPLFRPLGVSSDGGATLIVRRHMPELVACFLRKQPAVLKTNLPLEIDAEAIDALLPSSSMERLILSESLPSARLEVLQHGDVVPAHELRDAGGRLRRDVLARLTREGVSFVVNSVDDDVPAIARWVDTMERHLGHTVWANLYVTHGTEGALLPHYDDHDVLALQVRGSKRWYGHGTPTPFPLVSSTEDDVFGPPIWNERIGPGELLYLPRGEVHHTRVEVSPSVHITFGIGARTGVDFLRALLEVAEGSPRFREDLTALEGGEAMEDRERELKRRMLAIVDGTKLDAYLENDAQERRLRSLAHLTSNAPIAGSVLVPAVVRRFVLPASPTRRDEMLTLRFGGSEFRLSWLAARLLGRIVDEDEVTFEDLMAFVVREQLTGDVEAALSELTRERLIGIAPNG